jgi:hypothetical protein
MISFTHVEDYIEIIAGLKSAYSANPAGYLSCRASLINLARYDVNVIFSMAQQCTYDEPLTVRQAELACKIILKYERQLAAKNIDIAPVRTPQYRHALKVIDYTCRISIQNQELILRFPYNTDLINQIREFSKISQGKCKWDYQQKIWRVALTEFNLNWLCHWAKTSTEAINRGFVIDAEAEQLFQKILATEKQDYRIELCIRDGNVTIDNCPESLSDYIEKYIGGFNQDNILRLIDYSPILGFTVSEQLGNKLIEDHGQEYHIFTTNREVQLNIDKNGWKVYDHLMDYIDKSQRWPAVFYDPESKGILSVLDLLKRRYSSELVHSTADFRYPLTDKTRYIHSTKPISNIKNIPILISSSNITSGTRQAMFEKAEKIVFNVTQVYHPYKQTRIKNIAS